MRGRYGRLLIVLLAIWFLVSVIIWMYFDSAFSHAVLLGVLDYLLLGFPIVLPSILFGIIGGIILPRFTTIRTVYLLAFIVSLFLFVNIWASGYSTFSSPWLTIRYPAVVASSMAVTGVACIMVSVSMGIGIYRLFHRRSTKKK